MERMEISAIIALVGLIIAIARPIIKLNTVITQLSTVVEALGKSLETLTSKNSETHERLWDKLGEHEGTLSEHDKRITLIERL